jgi:hypothetical protein
MASKYRLIVLGAGFSVAADMPLAAPLWKEIIETVKRYGSEHRAKKFFDDLESYIAFKKDIGGVAINPSDVDFEDFMRYCDLEHFLGLRGGNTWSEDGNEATIVVKHLIGKILSGRMVALKEIPELYLEFARRLEPNDTVFTFNYDTLLERALEAVGKRYRLVPTRYTEVFPNGSGLLDSDTQEVTVLKVHGSIDWFDRRQYDLALANYAENNVRADPFDPVFNRVEELDLVRLADDPYPDDALKTIYRVGNLRALHSRDIIFSSTPRLVAPSATKLLYFSRLGDLWNGWGSGGYYNYGMSIIGFSLPQHDDYARQILHTLVTTYQRYNQDRDDLGRQKSPLTIVDFFGDDQAKAKFQDNYRFVDWSKTNLFGGGFDADCLDFVFA